VGPVNKMWATSALEGSKRFAWLIVFVSLASVSIWMDAASYSDVSSCERMVGREIAEHGSYFRTGYRFSVSGYTPGRRVLYISFIRPRHGLATCHMEWGPAGYRVESYSIEWGASGAPPRPLP
jgi:hypothetical protein